VPPVTRWSATLSSQVNLHHAINFGALYSAILVTQHPKIQMERNLRTPPCGPGFKISRRPSAPAPSATSLSRSPEGRHGGPTFVHQAHRLLYHSTVIKKRRRRIPRRPSAPAPTATRWPTSRLPTLPARERERDSVCERARERVCVCVCESERASERETVCASPSRLPTLPAFQVKTGLI